MKNRNIIIVSVVGTLVLAALVAVFVVLYRRKLSSENTLTTQDKLNIFLDNIADTIFKSQSANNPYEGTLTNKDVQSRVANLYKATCETMDKHMNDQDKAAHEIHTSPLYAITVNKVMEKFAIEKNIKSPFEEWGEIKDKNSGTVSGQALCVGSILCESALKEHIQQYVSGQDTPEVNVGNAIQSVNDEIQHLIMGVGNIANEIDGDGKFKTIAKELNKLPPQTLLHSSETMDERTKPQTP